MEKPTQEDVVTVSVDGAVIQTTTKHRELSKEALKEVEATLIAKGQEISEEVESWYPCGFASLNVHGNSSFVRFMKKNGEEKGNKGYKLGRIKIVKDEYKGGYNVYFDYPSKGPTEAQSLNFKRPLYSMFQDLLGLLSVETEMYTRID